MKAPLPRFASVRLNFARSARVTIPNLIILAAALLIMVCGTQRVHAQSNEWTWVNGSDLTLGGNYGTLGLPASSNVPGSRTSAATWTDNNGNLWLFGGSGSNQNDLWEYSPATGYWTWMGGSNLPYNYNVGGLPGVYGSKGVFAAANLPGNRSSATTWTDRNGNLWLFGGGGYDVNGNQGNLDDLWEFNPAINEWAWMGGSNTVIVVPVGTVLPGIAGVYGTLGVPAPGNMPGSRSDSATWTDSSGNLWLYGGYGADANGNSGNLGDLWEFSPLTNEWAWMGGSKTVGSTAVFGTQGTPSAGNVPGAVPYPAGWTDSSGNFWLLGSGCNTSGSCVYANILWEYFPSTKEWEWVEGTQGTGAQQPGVYGTLGVPSPTNFPGPRAWAVTWTDSNGNFWLFGGEGYDANGTVGALNDVWGFNPTSKEWVWEGGSSTLPASCQTSVISVYCGQPGIFGTQGTPAPQNIPSARFNASDFTGTGNTLWLFGGVGQLGNSIVDTNDLWQFQPPYLLPTAVPNFSLGAGLYPSTQTVTITDSTPHAVIYYTTDGLTPTINSAVYSGPITVSSSETLQAIAVATGYFTSAVASDTYTIGSPAATPILSVPGGTYTAVQTVTITDATAGAVIHYTTDGSTPTASSTSYSGAITVSVTETLQAIAIANGFSESAPAAALYTIDLPGSEEWTWMSGSNAVGSTGTYGTLSTLASGNTPGSRDSASTWTDSSGHLWLFGGVGTDSNNNYGFFNDLWEFNPSTNEWAWMGGSMGVLGYYEGQPGVYGTLGVPAAGNVPGGRYGATTWTDSSGHFWLFGGEGTDAGGNSGFFNDLWEFNPATGYWAWMSGSSTIGVSGGQPGVYGTLGTPAAGNIPGGRQYGASWTDSKGNLWLFGGAGLDVNGAAGNLSDLWEFNPSTSQWTWMGGGTIDYCYGSGPGCGIGVYGTQGTPAAGNIPGGRFSAVSWTDGSGNFWLFGGTGIDGNDATGALNDLWEFNPTQNQWTWMSGGTAKDGTGVYGTLGTPAAANVPGARSAASGWTDPSGNLWLFGGNGEDSGGGYGDLQDLWEFIPSSVSPSLSRWIWMGGASELTCASGSLGGLVGCVPPAGTYGTPGTATAGNFPGGRENASAWTDSSGHFWLFGGTGVDASDSLGELNDLWSFQPAGSTTTTPTAAATPAFSVPGGTYSTTQTVTISDATAGATIYYTTNGTPPTTGSAVYNAAITVTSNETIEAIATATGFTTSSVATAAYTITPPAATPTFSVPGGTYSSTQTVTLSDTTPGSTIYYTTSGTTPTTSSTVYSGPITVSSTETLEAIATASGYSTSAAATATYTISGGSSQPAATPTFSVTGGTYGATQTVTISDATAGATIYYTIDGTKPTTSSTQYSGAVVVSVTETLQAIAVAGGNTSAVATVAYTITSPGALGDWAWMGGSSSVKDLSYGPDGVYGTLGTPALGNAPGGRAGPSSWADSNGNLWLFGGEGVDSAGHYGYANDLWEYNIYSDEWTWMGGPKVIGGIGCASLQTPGNLGVYGTLGIAEPTNLPGGRQYSANWTDSHGNLWLFGGGGYDSKACEVELNDLWEFSPSSGEWTWISGSETGMNGTYTAGPTGVYGTLGTPAAGNTPGDRDSASTWTDSSGNLWLFGGEGFDANLKSGYFNDLWEFNPSTRQWAWMGGSSAGVPGLNEGQPGVYGTLGVPAAGNVPGGRNAAASWVDSSGNFWLFGGLGSDSTGQTGYLNDLWRFNPATSQWTWMGGSSTIGSNGTLPGVYGTLGLPAATNVPGGRSNATTWTDSSGNFWLFGGSGNDANGNVAPLNDLWEFNPGSGQWTWAGGSSKEEGECSPSGGGGIGSCGELGVYGTMGIATEGNVPGSRYSSIGWVDSNGNFWLLGGIGFDAIGDFSFGLNDFWRFQPQGVANPVAITPTFSVPGGTYSSAQTVTISDAIAGATIYYTTNNGTPTTSSTVYSGTPITVSSTETIRAIATASGYSTSNVAIAAYTITLLSTAATPSFSVPGGTYSSTQTVIISDATAGAVIYYTTNGTTPTSSSTVYSSPILVGSTETLEAIAIVSGYASSTVATAAYTIQISVPNVVGETQAAATSAIIGAGLELGTVTTASSSTVAIGNVISESPNAGTGVNSGSAVNLVVSTGPAQVAVPNVVGDTQGAATTAITGAGLVVGTVATASSSTVAYGNVISESPNAGTSVNTGSAVNLVISTGPAQVAVPNVVGDTQAAATTAITGAGLVLGTVTTASSSTVAIGNVISESPSAGTSVNTGSAVNLVVSTGPAQVAVPNVVGDPQAAATTAITGAGLVVGTVTTASSSTVASGNVISESPIAGTSVNVGSAINLVVSTGPAQVTVPNVVGDTQAAATSAIIAAGLAVGTVTTASSATVASGNVISESPSAGTGVNTGSAVNLVVSTGPAPSPSYTLVANPSSLTIQSGSSASTVITLTPTGGFTGTVNFACGTLPTDVTCYFLPTSLTVTSSTPLTTTLTIGTTGTATASLGNRPAGTVLPTLLAALILLPLGFMRRVLRTRKAGSQWFGLLLLAGTCLAAAGLLGTAGCGGSSSSTPAGTYSVPITVTSGSTTVPLNLSITID